MKIHIEGDIYLTGDNMGYQVAKRRYDKDGNVVYDKNGNEALTIISNWGSVQSAVENGLLKLKLAESTATTLRELIQEVRAYKEFVRERIDF